MPRTILVPIDGSGNANRAVEYAGDLAAHYEARIVLFHAVHYPLGKLPAELHEFSVSEHLDSPDEIRAMVGKILESAEERARQAGARNVSGDSRTGEPAETILEAARTSGADAIVMGSRGLGTLKGLIVGSVSRKILDHAEVPVTIVR